MTGGESSRQQLLFVWKGESIMELIYHRCGDYLLPDLGLSAEDRQPIGKYGHMRLVYLRKHRPDLYSRLLLPGS